MHSNQEIGLDLPLKVLAWEDAKGQAWLTYEKPDEMGERYGMKEPAEIFKNMAGVLDAVTTEAASRAISPQGQTSATVGSGGLSSAAGIN